LTDHKHLSFDDIEKYMGTNSSDEFEEGFLDYVDECLHTCENCQRRFRTWISLDSLTRTTPEEGMADPDVSNTEHKHLSFDDIEKYMGANSSDEFEEGFLDYVDECLHTCENCQRRFRTWIFLDSLMRPTLEEGMPDPEPNWRRKYHFLADEDIRNIERTKAAYNKLQLKAAS
jgi:hypothetical protein